MLLITDPTLADRIIALERGFTSTRPEWEEQVRAEILRLQDAVRDQIPITTNAGDGMIYGENGWNRYFIADDGQVQFLLDFCDYQRSNDEKTKMATAQGFEVI
jgi:hypothetical protein